MLRTDISLALLEVTISNGWQLAWFCVEEPAAAKTGASRYLLADVCCHWRLGDGRIEFYRIELKPGSEASDLARIEALVAQAQAQWHNALNYRLTEAKGLLG